MSIVVIKVVTKRRGWQRFRWFGLCCIFAASLTSCAHEPGYFLDVAERDGMEFVSYSGDRLWYLIDTLGAGVAAGDYDGDGDSDLFFLSGHAILDSFQDEADEHSNALWRNDGGTFTDVTTETGLHRTGWSNGAVFADYDDDGDLDLYVARHGPNLLYRNDGGKFVERAAEAGVDDHGFGTSACFFDYDGDGDLDLYAANYAIFDVAEQKGKVKWFTDGVKQFPQYFESQDNVLYRNDGNGRFTDVTEAAGAAGTGRSLGVVATDYDQDGDLDLFVANDVGFNNLLHNDAGEFRDVALLTGVACNERGAFEACMGVDAADIDNDGDMDLIVTNYGGEQNTVYRNEGDGFFVDATRELGLVNQAVLDCVGWGVGFHDFNQDQHLDLFVINGHVVSNMVAFYMRHWNDSSNDIPQMGAGSFRLGAKQTKLFFFGGPDGQFRDATQECGYEVSSPRMGRGAAFADLDLDGSVDVAVSNKNAEAQVLLNRFPNRGNWIVFDLRSPPPNRFAIGAVVSIPIAEGKSLTRELHAGTSYLSASELAVHFGLGEMTLVERVEVRWPDGVVEVFEDLEVNRRHQLERRVGAAPRSLSVDP